MEAVVGAVEQQLLTVKERRMVLEADLQRIIQTKAELREVRSQERTLLAALAKLQGEKAVPRQRRSPRDNEAVILGWLRSQGRPCTLSEIQRGVALPLSSVRNAVRRMADVSLVHGKLWSAH